MWRTEHSTVTISLVSMGRLGTRIASRDGMVEPSSQASVITLVDMQSSGCTAKPCCWICIFPVSDKRARVTPSLDEDAQELHLAIYRKRPKPTPALVAGRT